MESSEKHTALDANNYTFASLPVTKRPHQNLNTCIEVKDRLQLQTQ